MRSKRFGLTTLWILLGVMLCSGLARAEEEIDPPDRVARLSFIDGSVSLAPADTDDWADALLNRPITTGDRIWVDAGGRAEVQIGTSTIHLDENTGLAFLTLDDETLFMRLTDGAVAVHVHSLERNETVQIETPNTTVMLREPGEYAIDTEDDGDRTIVKARSGEAEVTGPDSSQHGYIVGANEQGIFTGSGDLSSVMTQAGRRSSFETWAYEREGRADQSVAANYVPPGTVGYQDLDSYGTWSSDPEYGNVWQPSMSYVFTDWAPYRYGRWIWVTPWGWTWVDDAPWGYAPFHYGRWTYLRQRWCWIPGPRHIHATYAPALVAWVGPPSFGVHFREVGWFPLGPREIYIPARRSSWRYFHNVNAWQSMDNTAVSNAYNGRNTHFNYRNRRAPHAVTVVDHDAFVSARRTHGRRVDVDADDLRRWRDQPRVPTIEPNADSRLGARPTGRPPAPHLDRQAVATRYQPVTKQRVLPSPVNDAAQAGVPPKIDAPRQSVATRSGTTRQWSGSNAGDRPSRLGRPPQSNSGQVFDDADPVDVPDDNDNQGAVSMLPGGNASRPLHRDAPSHADRPPRSSTAANPRLPAPVATPSGETPQASQDQPDQALRNQHPQRQERQERQAQQQQERQARQAQQQQAREARARAVPPQQPNVHVPQVAAPAQVLPRQAPPQQAPPQQAPPQQAPPRQVVQQPRTVAPAQRGEPNGRTKAPPQQRGEQRGGPATQPSEQSPRSPNGAGPGGNGTTRGSTW